MGDSETVVAQTSTVMGYTAEGHAPAAYAGVGSAVPEAAGAYAAGTVAEVAAPMAMDNPGYAVAGNEGNLYGTDLNSGVQGSQVGVTYETKPEGMTDTTGHPAGSENTTTEALQTANYGSANGNIGAEGGSVPTTENGNVEQQHTDGSAPSMSAEEERLWNIVRANSLDFNAWTALIEETEKVAENDISRIRKVYDAFLAEFPLCYGYWKKYADHEARFGLIDKVVEVYERAVQGVTYSVDIWLHYCLFAASTYGDPETIRRLFERGLAYVGTDYLSYPLWDRYIEYEYSQQDWGRLAMIYTRILENPIQQLDRYFNSFKELARSRPLSELKSAEEAATGAADASSESQGKVTEGEVRTDDSEQSTKTESAGSTEAEELEKYISIREEMYKKAKEFDSKIIDFETAIRRPYFHVRPLNDAELENWHNYLDFIEREADFSKVVKLYEQCLIACANYPEFWIRYVLCMQASGSMDLAENALARATQVFVKRQPDIHLFAARFREKNGDILGARAAYQLVHTEIAPGLIEAIVKHASMEYRLGKVEDACSLYEQAISIEKGKEHSQTLPMLYAQYSRFVFLVCGNAEKAREILVGALEHVQLSKPILEAIIHLESIQSLPKRIDYVDSLVDKFLLSNYDGPSAASVGEKEELSGIFLEFLDLFGDTHSINKASDRHAKLFLRHRSTSESRKRHADDFLASDKAKAAKSYSGAPSAQSVMGAYPGAQNPWAATYGAQAQSWPQAAQAVGQQWPAGYTPQAPYSGYPYGTNYTTPQVPSSVSQSAPYGAYPSTYPAQAAPQQSYSQPAAAASVAPAQPATSVPQAYYGTYY